MCGRFTLTVDPAELQEAFADYSFPPQFAPRFNIAPSQPVLAIPNDGKNEADFLQRLTPCPLRIKVWIFGVGV